MKRPSDLFSRLPLFEAKDYFLITHEDFEQVANIFRWAGIFT